MLLMNLFTEQEWRHRLLITSLLITDLWTRLLLGEDGEDRSMDRVTWKHTLPCAKQTANGNLLYDSRNSNQASVTA